MLPCFGWNIRPYCLCMLVAVCVGWAQFAHSQETEIPQAAKATVEMSPPVDASAGATKKLPDRPPVASEIAVTGMIPAGDYRMFSATVRCNAWTVGVEYDRNSWGR